MKNYQTSSQPFFVIIMGPTGVGKTELGDKLAQRLPVEIINSDVGQFYAPLTIGTAKPDWRATSAALGTPHHLFDHLEVPRSYSSAQFRDDAQKLMHEIHQRGRIPVVIGGSGFYNQALLYEFKEQEALAEWQSAKELPENMTWESLHSIDPQRAQNIHPHDTYRIQRAIDLWRSTGKLPSEYQPSYAPLGNYVLIYVNRDKDELLSRIEQRTDLMLQQGWIEEVAALPDQWKQFLKTKRIIGYPEILEYLEGRFSYDELTRKIIIATRQYAKRQRVFFKSLEKKLPAALIEQVNLTLSPVDLYLNQLVKKITGT